MILGFSTKGNGSERVLATEVVHESVVVHVDFEGESFYPFCIAVGGSFCFHQFHDGASVLDCGQSGALGGVSEHLEFVSVAHGEGDGLFVDVAILAVAQSE